MNWIKQLEICYLNYKRWKERAFTRLDLESRKAVERAFFWLEIHSAIWALGVLEARTTTKEEIKNIVEAKRKIVEKLSEYEKTLLDEMNKDP